jgi:hypothetical protein
MPLTIRYKKVWGAIPLAGGAFMTLTALLTGGPLVNLVTGPVLLILGAAYLVNPYAEVTIKSLTVLPPLRVGRRRVFEYSSPSELRIDRNRLYLGQNRIPISRAFAATRDWEALAAHVGT